MSNKAKYIVTKRGDSLDLWRVGAPDKAFICECYNRKDARRIARALNAMESDKKPKAKPFAFDWSGVPERFKFAALDPDWEWWAYTHKPQVSTDGTCFITHSGCETKVAHKLYPGDWRDSLQKRP